MHPNSDFSFVAETSDFGMRLDVVVSSHFSDYSRSHMAELIRQGKILVQGTKKKPGYRVCAGDEIIGILQPEQIIRFDPEPIPLSILYEDRVIMVIDKQAGLVVHPAPGHYTGTLVNAILHHYPDIKACGDHNRMGIVHRLDKDTSGTMVIAKTRSAHETLSRQFKDRQIKKEYLALVHGRMESDSGRITFPIGRHPVDRKKMSINSKKAREAETLWRVRENLSESTLIEVSLKTGRTHQIRAHCAAIHHPVIGDPVYGGRKNKKNGSDLFSSVKRQMLHSRRLGFTHPDNKKEMVFESPVPADMEAVIRRLRNLSR